MNKFKIIIIFIIISLFTACGSSEKNTENDLAPKEIKTPISKDISEIKAEGVLKALTSYSGTSYFLYRGKTMGFEYELLERFAEYLGVGLEIVVTSDIDSLFDELNDGEVDLVAHALTITTERKKEVNFTDYLYLTNQVLVQKKPDNWRKMKWSKVEKTLVHDAIELIDDTVSVRKNTSYFQRLTNLSSEIGGEIIIDTLPGSLATDEIIKMVVDGYIKYTIADKNIASINASYYPILDIDVPISFSQRIAWAVRSNSPELLEVANEWLKEFKKEVDYNVIFNKYFKNTRAFKTRIKSDFYSLNNNKISKYDDIIKKNAAIAGWDWRLLASLIYQESQFDPHAKSWAGAHGLMQIMPETAKELGVKDRSNPDEVIKGGVKYLNLLYERFDMVEDTVQRIKFAMASYNCGYGHVTDAQNLAEKRGIDRHLWDDHVDNMILDLSYPKNYNDPVIKYGYVRGTEPYNYVENIFERYDHYKQFIEE
jgi:membrane-bound lytic murein transglycosylase F